MVSFSLKPVWNYRVQDKICWYWFLVLSFPSKWDSDSGSDLNLWSDLDSRFESPKKQTFDKLNDNHRRAVVLQTILVLAQQTTILQFQYIRIGNFKRQLLLILFVWCLYNNAGRLSSPFQIKNESTPLLGDSSALCLIAFKRGTSIECVHRP